MLQHNWALVDSTDTDVVVYFLHDGGTTLTFNKRKHGFDDEGIVVDSLTFATMTDALDGLRRNGFTLETEFDHSLTNYRPSRPFFDGRSVVKLTKSSFNNFERIFGSPRLAVTKANFDALFDAEQ